MSFLSNVKSLLSSEEDNKGSSKFNENPNFIQRPSRIKRSLETLYEAHVHIAIIFDDKTEHTSRVLSITAEHILFDQLNNLAAHKKMVKGYAIQVHAKHHAVPLNFSTTVLDKTSDGYYLVAIPSKIYHPEKRSFFRMSLSEIEKYKFNSMVQFSENSVSGYIYDISYGGLSIAMHSEAYIKKGTVLSPASITLKNGNTLHVELTVRSINKTQRNGVTRIGCEFLDMDSSTKKSLHKFITECERERSKK